MRINFRMFKKISWKLTFIYAVIFSLLLVLLNASILLGLQFFLVQQASDQIESSSKAVVKSITTTTGNERKNFKDPEFLSEVQSNSDINIQIVNQANAKLYVSHNFSSVFIDPFSNIDRILKIEATERNLMFKNTIVHMPNGEQVFLQITKSMDKEYSFLKILFLFLALADGIGIIVSIFVGYIVSRKILKPIDKMTKTAQNISSTNLDYRIEFGQNDDELGRLASTFNEMIARLKLSFDSQNQFVSDASHELRTPISIIQGYINLIDRWGKDDTKVLQEAIDAIKNETAHMAELVEKLLTLAKEDSGTILLQKEYFLLGELIEEIASETSLIEPLCDIHPIEAQRLELFADRKMIKQMLRALIDNSIKFTPDVGNIKILTQKSAGMAQIIVQDKGIGIAEEDLEPIFNRFYRTDKSRTKDMGGTGLGLSIVKWIVEAHGGSIRIQSKVNLGTSIIILLPV